MMEVEQLGIINFKEEKDCKKEIIIENNQLPELYTEIYGCYKSKNYEQCLTYIEEVQEMHTEYQILKSACLIHLGLKVKEAHMILDEVLVNDPNNAYTIYAKGLAYYHEDNWEDSIECFERARELEPSPDMERAEIMMQKAQTKLKECENSIGHFTKIPHFRKSSGSNHIVRRFGCELCNHFFGKKFNLDRHNSSIHKRNTPANFPTNPKKPQSSVVSKVVSPPRRAIKVEMSRSLTSVSPDSSSSKDSSIRLNKTMPQTTVTRKGKVKCNVCKKLFKKSSISRHVIIHTGNKPHKCNQCTMAFFQKSDLSRHLATHSDELKFECEHCDRRFRIKKNLQVHKRRHHSNLE